MRVRSIMQGVALRNFARRRAARGELLYTEMACSLSHLRAMDLALKGWFDP